MKIRRILATAVAAAVTTPVVFLSAAPAFADTKPTPASTQKPASDEDDFEMPTLEELKAAVALAQKAYDEAVADVDKAEAAVKAYEKPDHALQVAVTAAKTAADAAATAKTAADEALKNAEKALAELPADATEEQKTAATAAVTAAKTAADAAATVKTAADEKLTQAKTALSNAEAAASHVVDLAQKVKESAAEKLAEAKEELEFFEEIPGDCEEDRSVNVDLTGPKKITAGTSAVFSLTVENTSKRTLDAVNAIAFATHLPTDWEEILEGEEPKQFITVEWTGAGNPHWSPITEEFDAIEIGSIAKGGKADVKLRLTLDPKTPAGKGVAFANGSYENEDGSCGLSEQYSNAYFDILAAGTTEEPKPTPSETTSTPTTAPSTGGNDNTTQQGGSSNTPVNGSLAATGANDHLNQIGLAAGAAVVLGAGAVFVARRRKAGASA